MHALYACNEMYYYVLCARRSLATYLPKYKRGRRFRNVQDEGKMGYRDQASTSHSGRISSSLTQTSSYSSSPSKSRSHISASAVEVGAGADVEVADVVASEDVVVVVVVGGAEDEE